MSNVSYPATQPSGAQAQGYSVVVGYVDTNVTFQPATTASGLPVAGGGGGGGGGAVTVADGADVTQGAIADAAVAAGAAGTVNQHLRSISRDMGTVAANMPVKGQATMANSQPVAIASDQSAIPVTVSANPAPADITVAATNITTQNLNPNSGTATAGSTVSVTLNGQGLVTAVVSANTLNNPITAQITYDGLNWVVFSNAVPAATAIALMAATANISAGVTGQYQYYVAGAKGFRLSANSAVTGSASVALNATIQGTPQVQNVNLTQLVTGAPPGAMTGTGGSTSAALAVFTANSATSTDYSAQAWAATSGSGATVTDTAGAVCSFDVNLSAFTAGSSTGLDIFLQYSTDGGTTWYDLWQCEALTATGHVIIPALMIPGARRRMRWANRGGAATTATVTVTANRHSVAPAQVVRQWFDRTAAAIAGTPNGSATLAYDVSGCKNVTATIVVGTMTGTGATYGIQTSADGTNWTSVGSPIGAVTANSVTDGTITNNTKRFARVIVTTAATGGTQTGTYIAITGSN